MLNTRKKSEKYYEISNSLHTTILRFYKALCKPCKSKIRLCHMCGVAMQNAHTKVRVGRWKYHILIGLHIGQKNGKIVQMHRENAG